MGEVKLFFSYSKPYAFSIKYFIRFWCNFMEEKICYFEEKKLCVEFQIIIWYLNTLQVDYSQPFNISR